MQSTSAGSEKNPLDAAQKIVAELRGMTLEHQSLALKFATETLGVRLPNQLPMAAAWRDHSQQPLTPQTASSAGHSTDIRAFTAMKEPKSDQQFAAVAAYFYQFEAKLDDRKEAIDADTMKEAARLAGRPQVARWNMTLTNAKNAGYLDAAGSGKFRLSSVGENLVAITLPDSGEPGRAKTKRGKKNTKRKFPRKGGRKT